MEKRNIIAIIQARMNSTRLPKKVLMDVLNHKVSLSKAKEDYGVCINTKTMTINYKATEKKRNALKPKTYQ